MRIPSRDNQPTIEDAIAVSIAPYLITLEKTGTVPIEKFEIFK